MESVCPLEPELRWNVRAQIAEIGVNLGIDEVQRTDLRETRRMTKRRALFSPEIVLKGVRFPVSEVPLYRGELYDTYRGTTLIRHTCSP